MRGSVLLTVALGLTMACDTGKGIAENSFVDDITTEGFEADDTGGGGLDGGGAGDGDDDPVGGGTDPTGTDGGTDPTGTDPTDTDPGKTDPGDGDPGDDPKDGDPSDGEDPDDGGDPGDGGDPEDEDPGDDTPADEPDCPDSFDFDLDQDGTPIEAGQDLADVYADWGISLSVWNVSMTTEGRGIAFDSSNPTGGDVDLGTPGEDSGGPGEGDGGATNTEALGMLLIKAENTTDNNGDGLVDEPDDDGAGAVFVFEFDTPRCVEYGDLVDVEADESNATFLLYDGSGNLLLEKMAGGLGDNSYERVNLDVCGVERMEVELLSSGALDFVSICPDS